MGPRERKGEKGEQKRRQNGTDIEKGERGKGRKAYNIMVPPFVP